jgi:cobalt-zinc-cadmium efflux system outer membrane protein
MWHEAYRYARIGTMKKSVYLTFVLGVLLCAGGPSCAHVHSDGSFVVEREIVEERTGFALGAAADAAEGSDALSPLPTAALSEPLGVDDFLKLVLLNNPRLLATFAELGIERSEVVRAGILRNPTLSGSVGFPLGALGAPSLGLGLVQSLLDVFVRPMRLRLARCGYAQAQSRIIQTVLNMTLEAQEAFFQLQASQELLLLQQTVKDATHVATRLKCKQWQTGNIAELEYRQQQALDEQMQLDLDVAQASLIKEREGCNVLMGLWSSDVHRWTIKRPDVLPKQAALASEDYESIAVLRRLDLEAARQKLQLAQQALHYAKTMRFIGEIDVGISASRDSEGPRLLGPSLSLELPLFNRRQPLIARLEAEMRQARLLVQAIAIEIRSEVRQAAYNVQVTRAIAERNADRLVPIRHQIVSLSQLYYNNMLLGVYPLVANKQAEIMARRQSIEAMRNYWVSQARLERALGGRRPYATEEQP